MLLMQLVAPKYLMPIGGNYRHAIWYKKLAQKTGFSKDSVFILEEGQTLEIDNNQNLHLGPIVPLKNIMVDGLGIGDVGKVVLRDRQVMAEEGMLVVIVPLEVQTGKLSGNIEIISRGVVYMK